MGEGFLTIQEILELIRLDLITVAEYVVVPAQSLAAIGALIFIAKIAYEGMLGGQILSMRMFRPFAIAILLALYPQFMSVVDGIAMLVNTSLGRAMITDEYRITDVLRTRDLNPETDTDEELLGIEDIQTEEGEEESSLINTVTDGISDAVSGGLGVVKWIGESFYWARMRLIEEILFRLSHGMLMIINALRIFFLVVLYIFGPLVIGLSAFPGFESAFGSWMGRYINVHLWLGIGNIFEAIAMRLWRIIVDNDGFWVEAIGIEDAVNKVMLTSWSMIFLLVLIVGYAAIPTVSGWILSASGIGRAGTRVMTAGSASIGKAYRKQFAK